MATEHQQCGADDLLLFAFFNAGLPAQGKRLGQVFSKTTDFERIAAKRHQIPRLRDLRFSKTILEMICSK
jgi:hypothetical protein